MRTAAQLDRRAEADHAHLVAVLLAEEHHRTAFLSLLLGGFAVLFERIVGPHGAVYKHLDLAQLLRGLIFSAKKIYY